MEELLTTENALSLVTGLALAAAAGFRVFVPPLVVNLAARFGWLDLSSGFDWLASDVALFAFAGATVLEVGAYLVPWVDNLLDTLATPTAVAAGAVVAASVFGDVHPLLKWSAAIVGGGGSAALFQGMTAGTRGLSSAATGGLANPVFALLELASSALLSILAVLAPLFAAALLVAFAWIVLRFLARRAAKRREAGETAPAARTA